MKIMPCPLNGPRNISEFAYGGDVTDLPDVDTAPDKEWAEHTFYAYNGTGVAKEWWYHIASGYWFIAERHRVTDEIIRTYDPSDDPSRATHAESVDVSQPVSEPASEEISE